MRSTLIIALLLTPYLPGNAGHLDDGSDVISAKLQGAKGDAQTVYDAVIPLGSTTLTSASATFTTNDIGKIGIVSVWNPAFHWYAVTITGFIDPHSISVTHASYSFVKAEFQWGTDDRNAINAAASTLTHGGVLFFPAGVYMMSSGGLLIPHTNITLKGYNRYTSVLTTNTASHIVQSNYPPSPPIAGLLIEDLGFDGHFVAATEVVLEGGVVKAPIIRGCRFVRTGNQFIGTDASWARIDNNEFDGYGTLSGTAVALSNGASHVQMHGNYIRYTYNGLTVSTLNGHVAEDISVKDNLFDLGWYLGRTAYSNSGISVTYAATSLTDRNARFPRLDEYLPVRVLVPRLHGSGASTDGAPARLVDASANFIASGVLRGDLVKMGGALGIVSSVVDSTHLNVEEWLDEVSKLPVQPLYSSYEVYRLLIGRYVAARSNSTTLTMLDGWHDWYGNAVVPAKGALYEVQVAIGNYPIHMEQGTHHAMITGNVVRRGYSDQISYYGTYGVIANNVLSDGQDMGITVNGDHQIVTGNQLWHSGAGGLWVNASYSTIYGNVISATTWMNFQNTEALGDIIINTGVTRTVIAQNICDGVSNEAPWAPMIHRFGITLVSNGNIVGNSIHGNQCGNHAVADLQLSGGGVSANEIFGNIGTIKSAGGATYIGLK